MEASSRKYLDVINQWDEEPLAFTSLSAKRIESVSSATELSQLKDYLSKLKFNYLELETKRIFLQQLRSAAPSRHAVQHNELEMEESKKKLKDLKAANQKLTNDITALVNAIADGFAEFEKDKKALLRELEVYQQLQEERAASLEKAPIPSHLAQQLNDYKTANHALLSLSGFNVQEISSNQLRVPLHFDDASVPPTALVLSFALNTRQLSGATLTPAVIAFEDLLEEALRVNDPAFLVREIQMRITNIYLAKKEISELQFTYHIVQDNVDTLTIRFASASAVLKLGTDYPQPHARVFLSRVDGIDKAIADSIKTAINSAPIAPLQQVLVAVQQRLDSAKLQ